MQTRRSVMPMAFAVVLVTLSACGGDKTEENARPTAASSAAKEPAPAPPAPAAAPQPAPAPAPAPVAAPGPAAAPSPAAQPAFPADKESLVLRSPGGGMPTVKFPHKKHAVDLAVPCKTCHHKDGDVMGCTKCHKGGKGANGEPSFKDAAHERCIGCHKEKKAGPTVCMKCHK
jgi:hypothetical protein